MPDVPHPVFTVRERSSGTPSALAQSGAWLFSIALIALVASLVVFGGLFAYKRSLASRQAEWNAEIDRQEAELSAASIGELLASAGSLAAARELLASHAAPSNLFALLEAAVHPRVQFTSFNFSKDSGKIDLSGFAASYQSVAEQVSLLEARRDVERVEFGGLSLGERGLVSFKLAVIIKPALLRFKP